MSYPLIILGAGASFDFLRRDEFPSYNPDLDQYIPPLTNRLFDGTKFHEIISKYPEMSRLVDYIQSKLRADNPKTFEQILTNVYEERIKVDEDLYVSFISLLFYISNLFKEVSEKYYRENNNYGALLKMLGFYGNTAIFVNFNYDLLLERALGKTNIKYIDGLLEGSFPVIKIHGGYNWFWSRQIDVWDDLPNCYDVSLKNAKYLITNNENDKWKLVIHNIDPKLSRAIRASGLTGFSFHPALALPTAAKNNYICPDSHIEFLKRKIKEVDRIVIIGWKVGDPYLRDLIIEELKNRKIPIAFIGKNNTKDLVEGFDETIKSNIKLIDDKGFSHFLSNDEGEEFLSNNADIGDSK